MPVTPISKVVTANDLKSGEVIYLRFPHSWTPDLTKASVITDRDLAKASLVFAQGQANVVVGAYLSDVIKDADGITIQILITNSSPSAWRNFAPRSPGV
jgi:hypothetical protein